MTKTTSCKVFWGGHGCALPAGHVDAAVLHQCGLDFVYDGLCSRVTWEMDPVLGEERWVCRFADEGGGWGATPYPVVLFGSDAPANAGTPADCERVRAALRDAGVLPR